MALEKEAGSDVRKVGLIVTAVVFTLAGGGYLLYGKLTAPPAAPSHVDIDRLTGGAGRPVPENPAYRQMLQSYNAQSARQASADGQSFVASISEGIPASPVPPPPPQAAPASLTAGTHNTGDTGSAARTAGEGGQPGLDSDRKKALDAVLKNLTSQHPARFTLAMADGEAGQESSGEGTQGRRSRLHSGQDTGQNTGQAANAFAAWTQSLSGPAGSADTRSGTSASSAGAPDIEVVPPYTRVPGLIETAVDSDNTGSQVIARIPAGTYAGAVLHASHVRLAGDGVEVHFTRMTWRDETFAVDAWALSDETLASTVASHVNNRYFSRIILPALATGIGGVGQLYADANTQILTDGYNQVTANVGMPDGKAVAGTIIGDAAAQAGQVMASDAARLPVKQVTVDPGQAVAIQFIGGVYESDNVRKQQGQQKAQRQDAAAQQLQQQQAQQRQQTDAQAAAQYPQPQTAGYAPAYAPYTTPGRRY